MSALLAPPAPDALRPAPRPYRWTVKKFHDVVETGQFEGLRPMLIDGEILEQGPMNPPHAVAVSIIVEMLRDWYGNGWCIRPQLPLVLGLWTDPHPDVAVVPGKCRDYAARHPSSAPWVIEVADSSLDFDTVDKAELYAAAGVADYWVLDVVGPELHVFRAPEGGRYADRKLYPPEGAVAPLLAPDKPVRVADLLP